MGGKTDPFSSKVSVTALTTGLWAIKTTASFRCDGYGHVGAIGRFCTCALGQVSTGAVRGTGTDAKGAAMAG